MAIQVRVPTILRSHTGEAKVVEGAGETPGAPYADLDTPFPGLRGWLASGDGADGPHRFVDVCGNAGYARFRGGLDAVPADGDDVAIPPTAAGGAPPGPGGARGRPAWGGRPAGRTAGRAAALRRLRARCAAQGR